MNRNLFTSIILTVCAAFPMLAVQPTPEMSTSRDVVYNNVFATYGDFDECIILDKNNDGICWDWREFGGSTFAQCLGTTSGITANDWLITPEIALEAGHSYRMVVETQCIGVREEKFECRWGEGYHVENLSNPAILPVVMDERFQETPQTVEGIRVDITRDGAYHFSYHLMSDPGTSGVAVFSLKIVHLGLTCELPDEEVLVYSEQFDSPATFNNQFKKVDMNGDGATWSHNNDRKCAQYTYSSVNAADDWLITPAVQLNVGRNYSLTFKASTASMSERIQVRMGRSDKPGDMEEILVESIDIAKRSELELGNELFKVAHSGEWYIGFHAISDKDCDKLYVDDIEIYDIGANGETEDPGTEPPKGSPIPYSADMTQPDVFAGYTVVDANYDGRTWKYDPIFNTTLYGYSPDRDADDWLITPPLTFESGKSYRLSVTAASRGKEYPEKFEARLGNGVDIMSYTQDLISPFEIVMNVGDPALRVQSAPFSVDKTGNYNIGIHALSVANMSDLLVNAIEVEEVYLDAPCAVSNLEASADNTGNLKTTLSFNAPVKNYAGHPLTAPITKIDVKRGDKPVVSLTDVEPGEKVIVTDDDPEIAEGMNQYTVTPFIGEHAGESAQVNVFIGNDIPLKLSGVNGTDLGGEVRLEWDEAQRTGKNGGTVYPALVSYNIYRAEPVYEMGIMISVNMYKLKTVKDTYLVLEVPELSDGEQGPIHFAITAETSAGESQPAYANLIKGKPYGMPFRESFENAQIHTYISVDTDAVGEESGLYITESASDSDGGAIAFVSYEADKYVAVFTGKVEVKGSTEPHICLYARNSIGKNLLKMQVITPDNARHDLAEITPDSEYIQYDFDLSDYRDCLWVRFIIATEFPIYVDIDYGNELDVDNIFVYDKQSGIESVSLSSGNNVSFPCDVYSADGILLRKNACDLSGLSGIVIINGHKYRLR